VALIAEVEGIRMDPDLIGYVVAAGFALAVAAFFVGRVTGGGATRRRELEEQLANAHEDIARLAAEVEGLLEQLRTAREEHENYRLSVVDHFSGTSDLLRDLTVQYRSVYEHLTKGASTLCPEGFVGLTEGLPVPEIAEALAEPERAEEAELFEPTEPGAVNDDSEGNAPTPVA
jgi:uncharacterized membrane-anchored protein YhcB (DUF1043 family)